MIFWEKLKPIKLLYEMYTKPIRDKYGLTQMEFNILLFLYNHKGCDTAADIVKMRKLTKSHVSSSIKHLMEEGFLDHIFEEHNHKKIHLLLTEQAVAMIEEGKDAQIRHRDTLLKDFTEEEKKVFEDMFHRISMNAEQELKKKDGRCM